MTSTELFNEILNQYRKHGWELRSVLLRPETRLLFQTAQVSMGDAQIEEAAMDALWFSRPSHAQREAWELRLLAENPYALFETFEKDETNEQREEMRREMEARLRDYVTK